MPDRTIGAAHVRRMREALFDTDALVRAVLSAPGERLEIRPVALRAGPRVQVSSHGRTRNLTREEFAAELDTLLAMDWRSVTVATTANTLRFHGSRLEVVPGGRVPDRTHDRARARVIEPAAPFLRVLGVAGPDGRIHANRQAKYRQVDKFVRLLGESVPLRRLPRPVRVADLGCGNADLTFATYHYLTRTLSVECVVTGVDARPETAERNNALARELGWSSLRFVSGRIADWHPDEPPDVVIALHACDTATDEALARAVEWGTRVVLAAPCCHRHLQRQLGSNGLLRHAITRQRFGDLLTDTLRAALLATHGYRADLIQFVSSEHTAKNLLIRAVRTRTRSAEAERSYRELCSTWGVRPYFEDLLDRVVPREVQ